MIVINELAFAEKMNKKGFIKRFSIFELSIYAKWLNYLIINNSVSIDGFENKVKYIEKQLIDFSNKYYSNFKYDVDYKKIDKAISSIDKYNLRIPISINVTNNEFSVIQQINNESYQRVLFIMLILSKYYKINNTKIDLNNIKNSDIYYCNIEDNDIFKLANVKFRNKELINNMWHDLYKLGLIGITNGRKSTRIVNFVDLDDDSEIKCIIKDYEHIILYYEKLLGKNISTCKYDGCNRLFIQNSKNNIEYCSIHKGYQPLGKKIIQCVDCSKKFEVDGIVKNKIRCDECQKIYIRKLKTKKQKEYRNK